MAVSHALVVKIDARSDRAEDVATFLAGAQPLAEAERGARLLVRGANLCDGVLDF